MYILLEHTSQSITLWRVLTSCLNTLHKVLLCFSRVSSVCTSCLNTLHKVLPCEGCWKYFHGDEMIFMFPEKSKWNQITIGPFRIYFDFLEKWKSQLLLWKYFRGSDKLLESLLCGCKQRVYNHCKDITLWIVFTLLYQCYISVISVLCLCFIDHSTCIHAAHNISQSIILWMVFTLLYQYFAGVRKV